MEKMVVTQPQFWRDKKVFITGHTGFKGAWLSLVLNTFGATVKGFSLPPQSTPNLFDLAKIKELIKSEFGNICDYETLQKSMIEFEPDIVLHLAAQALVRDSYKNPIETVATNVLGTAHVIEAVRHCSSVRATIVVTTDKCYQNNEWIWPYRESDRLGGKDPYSASKACAEIITESLRFSFFDKKSLGRESFVASARAGNVIGGGDWAQDRLIPDAVQSFSQSQAVLIRNPKAVRPWQHVLEPLSGYLLLAEKLYLEGAKFAEGWNFGPVEEGCESVKFVVDMCCKLWGGAAEWKLDTKEQPHEAHLLKLDISKAKRLLHWAPNWSLSQGIEETMNWYKAFYLESPDKALEMTNQQIRKYFLRHQ